LALFIDEPCVASLLTMDDALAAVEEVFREQGRGGVVNVPRVRAPLKGGVLRITAGILSYRGLYGVKVSSTTVFGRNAGRMFCLYREDSGELLAVVQVFGLGALRTGAASGVATKFMAKKDATTLAVLGSGRQARTQVEAICRVRRTTEVKVYSPTKENRERFCREIAAAHGLRARPVDSPEAAVRESEIIVTATTSEQPVVQGRWLAMGAHVNAIGANYEHRRELDTAVVKAAACIAVDDPEQARYEATDLVVPVQEGALTWERVHPLSDVVSGQVKARSSPRDITLYKSLGVAIEDVALAARAYEKALAQGAGIQLPDLAG
jgi:ornithine cyclodeaminase/alanine dehydrogenase-like protein (mu-crystallin family)